MKGLGPVLPALAEPLAQRLEHREVAQGFAWRPHTGVILFENAFEKRELDAPYRFVVHQVRIAQRL